MSVGISFEHRDLVVLILSISTFEFTHLPGMFLSPDRHLGLKLLPRNSFASNPYSRVFSMGVPGFANDCPCAGCLVPRVINTLRPRQDGRHFPDDIFKRIFFNENARISLKISLKFVPKVRINNIPALVQIMVWRRPGDRPLSEPMMVSLSTHICVTRPQWVTHLPIVC